MEAWRFGFDPSSLPSTYKFDPTDTDIVVHYLLPRVLRLHNPYEHAVVDADPCSCPPWEFMRRHGHADSDHAFFFGPPRGRRAARGVLPGEDGVGGNWDVQKSVNDTITLVRGGPGPGPAPAGGAEMEMPMPMSMPMLLPIKYKRSNLSYTHGDEDSTSGWVMHEYQIMDPPQLSNTVLSRVKITGRAKKKAAARNHQQQQQQQNVPDPDQPGPSNYGEQSEVVHLGDGNGSVVGEQTGVYFVDDGNSYLNEAFSYHQYLGDGGGFSFAVGDNNGNYANDVGVVGETGAYDFVNDYGYLNDGSRFFFLDPADGGGSHDCFFNVGDNTTNCGENRDGGNQG